MMDTPSKRASAIGVALPTRLVLPIPDGSVEAGDRQNVAYCYAGIVAGELREPPAPSFAGGRTFHPQGAFRLKKLVRKRGGALAAVSVLAIGEGAKRVGNGSVVAWTGTAEPTGEGLKQIRHPLELSLAVEAASDGFADDPEALLQRYAEQLLDADRWELRAISFIRPRRTP